MWPWLARAAYDARSGVTPSRATRWAAISSGAGVASTTRRVRDRIVGSTSSTVGAHRIHTVRAVGSSIALSSALQACSVSRSASSMIITCHRSPTGESAALRTSSRTSSTPIESFCVRVTEIASWEPIIAVWHEWHSPQPSALALEGRGERDAPRWSGPSRAVR